MRHVRALLATGSSARSVREQLYLNGGFFLSAKGYEQFKVSMPELRWFQMQREGMGNESLLYSLVWIAQCEEVVPYPNPNPNPNPLPYPWPNPNTNPFPKKDCTMGVRRD